MEAQKKEIIAGKGFYYMPSAYVTLKVTVEGIYDHEKMKQAVFCLEEAHPVINNVLCKSGDKMWFEEVGKHVPIIYYNDEKIVKWEDALLQITTEPINLMENPRCIQLSGASSFFRFEKLKKFRFNENLRVSEDVVVINKNGEIVFLYEIR